MEPVAPKPLVWSKKQCQFIKVYETRSWTDQKKWPNMTFFEKITTLEVWNHFFPIFFVLSTPLKITNIQFFSLVLVCPWARNIFFKIKDVSVESDNNFWKCRFHRFWEYCFEKNAFKVLCECRVAVLTHAFSATQMPITSGILRIPINPFKHAFLKGWTFEKWNKKKSILRPDPPLKRF